MCAWNHEDGCFIIKDPWGMPALGNDVRYPHEQFERLLVGVLDNRFILRAVS